MNNRGKPMKDPDLRKIILKISIDAGLTKPKVTPIILRNTCLALLLREGANLTVLREIAGHVSLESTKRYQKVVQNDLRDAVKKFPLG
ncbi:MAG: hypothetical protein D5S00_06655 [Tindallia sp. MSAO_Bac2]|nr:MAG: hypothetical protein D5S00_06655 [Tindallia sp. MSAO_Bac2]